MIKLGYWSVCFLICLLMQPLVLAQQKLVVAVGWDKPPYVIEALNSGYEVELVRDVLAQMGMSAKFVPVPYGRSYEIIGTAGIQAAMTLSQRVDTQQVHLSDIYIYYQNAAISLQQSNLLINGVTDMQSHAIVAFQNARHVLGDTFAKMVEKNTKYSEVPDQQRQVRLLLDGRTELVVMDVNIFAYFRDQLSAQQRQQPIVIHELFPPTGYRMGFTDPKQRDAFNQALRDYQSSPRFLELQTRYGLFVSKVAESHARP